MERDGAQFLHLLREPRPNVSYCELSDNEEDYTNLIEYEEDDQQNSNENTDFDQRTEHVSDDENIEPQSEPQGNGRGHPSFTRGKNNFKWSLIAPETRGWSSMYLPSAKFEAKDVTTPLEAWSLLFSPNILEIIVRHTNEEIERKRENCSYQKYYDNTDVMELKAFLGLLYFGGLKKDNDSNTEDMWSPRFGGNLYKIVMTQHRFTVLLTCLRFDDKDTRAERRAVDTLAPIKEIWDLFIENCTKYYSPSTNCTLDELLLELRGHFGTQVYTASKPDKYGIKIVSLNDAQTSYMINAEPYVEQRVTTNGSESLPSYYIRKLSEPLYNTKRNVTCGNWFTSVEIVQHMKRKYSLTMVGTLRKNKREVPPLFTRTAPAGTVRFAYTNDSTLVSYCPKQNKVVLLLSSLHEAGKIDKVSGKPEIVLFYDSTKGGTDTFDKLCKTYSTARITQRLPLRLFFSMLDQASVNSVILFNLRTAKSVILNRRSFLKELAFALIQPHLESRLQNQHLPRNIKNMIHEMLEIEEDPRERVDKLEKELINEKDV